MEGKVEGVAVVGPSEGAVVGPHDGDIEGAAGQPSL